MNYIQRILLNVYASMIVCIYKYINIYTHSCISNCDSIFFGFHIWSVIKEIWKSQESEENLKEVFMTAAFPMSQIKLHSSTNWFPIKELGNICGVTFLDPTVRCILYTANTNRVVLILNLMNILPVGLTPLSACSFHCNYSLNHSQVLLLYIIWKYLPIIRRIIIYKVCSVLFILQLSLPVQKK